MVVRRRKPKPPVVQLTRPYRHGRAKLRDGRTIAFAEFGAEGGRPIFWFHGTPGARTQLPPDAPAEAGKRGFRIIGVDRPGFGHSSHSSRRTILSWADDMHQLADHLDVDRFAMIGLSGGGPYVLACAHEMPGRVIAGVSLGGVGPTDGSDGAPGYAHALLRLAMRGMPLMRGPLGIALSIAVQPMRPFAGAGIELYKRFGPVTDRPVFEIPEFKQMFAEDIVISTSYGLRGPVGDVALFCRPWGFSPADIRVPIRIWHGDADLIVPLSHSEHLAEIIPDSELRVVPDLGHFAGFVNAPEVLDTIDALWRR